MIATGIQEQYKILEYSAKQIYKYKWLNFVRSVGSVIESLPSKREFDSHICREIFFTGELLLLMYVLSFSVFQCILFMLSHVSTSEEASTLCWP